MNPETLIEVTACKKVLDELGVFSIKLTSPGTNGMPDRIFLIPGGKPLLIEFKDTGKEPEPLQTYTHNLLRQLGYNIEVHDNVIDAFNAVHKALHTAQAATGSEVLAEGK